MTSASTHFYRLEISGPHTGSAYRFHSAILGTIGEVKEALVEELSDTQGLSFLVAEKARVSLELYEDGKLSGQWNLYPALKLRVPKRKTTLSFLASGRIEGVKTEDPGRLFEDPLLGPLLEGEIEARPQIDFTPLALPVPRGLPLREGAAIAYTRDGKAARQPYGWVGDWNDPKYGTR